MREISTASSLETAAGPPEVGEIFQPGAAFVDRSGNSPGCIGIAAFDPFANALRSSTAGNDQRTCIKAVANAEGAGRLAHA
jgi:hypothetical protein